MQVRDGLAIATRGATRDRVNLTGIGQLAIVVPSLEEQRAITEFLDLETARIDALIEKKERLIALLKEERAALINRAVTKGLDPGAAMRDSEFRLLGAIPAHWETRRLQ